VNNALAGLSLRHQAIQILLYTLLVEILMEQPLENGNMQEDVEEAVKHQAKRTAMIASWIKNGNQ
jgi:hypothetical protein